MSFLQLLWYAVIGLLFIIFLVLDGADFGVGMATRFLASNYTERKLLLRTIGPHWDGNEVFLVTAEQCLLLYLDGCKVIFWILPPLILCVNCFDF